MATTKSVTPSIRETAFDCPHCGAYTTQTWHDLYAKDRSEQHRTPIIADPAILEQINKDPRLGEAERELVEAFKKEVAGLVTVASTSQYVYAFSVGNLHLAQCFNCRDFSVWVHDRLLFPASRQGPPPNPDMPDPVRADYEEASRILAQSPRGAAALLRLAIQKLCAELDEKGKDINADIASLVKKGLSSTVQKALDSVRVIGNEAVHPGTLDLKDDSETAGKLFRLVNIIVEQMISNPKHVEEVFGKLPEEKRKAIEKRDKK
jgi:Domain of unknown function (DUF4145)